MYLEHFSGVSVPQNVFIPWNSSSLFRGFTVVRIKCFNSCHMIGFKSGLSGGVGNRDTLLSLRNFSVDLEVWHGALSCCNLPSGNCSRKSGNRWVRSTSWYAALLTDPLSRHIFDAPFFDIPAHTMTLKDVSPVPSV